MGDETLANVLLLLLQTMLEEQKHDEEEKKRERERQEREEKKNGSRLRRKTDIKERKRASNVKSWSDDAVKRSGNSGTRCFVLNWSCCQRLLSRRRTLPN